MRSISGVILAAVIATAWAACPNSCSGHGSCNEIDRCVCFKSQGTTAGQRASWTGADCSQRVCPYGTSFGSLATGSHKIIDPIGWIPETRTTDANAMKAYLVNGFQLDFDFNFEVEITSFSEVSAGDGTGTYRFKRDVDRLWSSPQSFDTSTAVGSNTVGMNGPETAHELVILVNNVQKQSGVYIYFDPALSTALDPIMVGDKWFVNVTRNDGSNYMLGNDGSSHQNMECSGTGICNRRTGSCECFAGYSGSNCGRTSCPMDCSGHGLCEPLSRFASEAGLTYTAYDANKQYGCRCDSGYRGAACNEMECPAGNPIGSSTANECSLQGSCDRSTGLCKCYRGFFGERCESLTTLV